MDEIDIEFEFEGHVYIVVVEYLHDVEETNFSQGSINGTHREEVLTIERIKELKEIIEIEKTVKKGGTLMVNLLTFSERKEAVENYILFDNLCSNDHKDRFKKDRLTGKTFYGLFKEAIKEKEEKLNQKGE